MTGDHNQGWPFSGPIQPQKHLRTLVYGLPSPPWVSVTPIAALSLFPAGFLPGLECSCWGGPFPYLMEMYEKAKQEKCVGLVKGRVVCDICLERVNEGCTSERLGCTIRSRGIT